jgi:cytochrome d ubiquinol oxidase subunit I
MGNSACSGFTLFGIPDQDAQENHFAIQIPYALGIIATRSVDTPVIGLKDLMVQHEERIRNGMKAYALLEQLRAGSTDQAVRDQFNSEERPGLGLLLKRYTDNVSDATEAQIQMATKDSILRCAAVLRFPYHGGCGILMLLIIAVSFWTVIRNRIGEKKWLRTRCTRFRCRGLLLNPVGLSQNMAVSRGRLVRCANSRSELVS